MDRLRFVTGSVVAVKSQSVAENGEVVIARLEDEVTLKRYKRVPVEHQSNRSRGT